MLAGLITTHLRLEYRHLQNFLIKKGIKNHIVPNNNTLRSEIFRNSEINFKRVDSIGHSLGFKSQILKASTSMIERCTRFVNFFQSYHQDINS